MEPELKPTRKLLILKYIAMAVFILIPFISFYFGMQYQKNNSLNQNVHIVPTSAVLPTTAPTITNQPTLIPITQPTSPTLRPEDLMKPENLCPSLGGKWLPEHNECESITQRQCSQLFVGTFNECASPCRHNPNAEVCIQLCVPVCTIK